MAEGVPQLSIQILTTADFEAYHELVIRNRLRLQRYFPKTVQASKSELAIRAYFESMIRQHSQQELFPFGIRLNDRLIGYCSAKNIDWRIPKCELAYYIDLNYEGRGYTSAALRHLVDFCFTELKMIKIFLRIGPGNAGSKRLAEKFGFVEEGCLRREFRIETGGLIDVLYYGLLVDPGISSP